MKQFGGVLLLALWAALTLPACAWGLPATAGIRAMCNPFGDPPAIVSGTAKPDCLHGQTLGPWKDPGGYERYACLWEPSAIGSSAPLPLVIYLHPSVLGPGTVTKTDLLRYQNSASLTAGGPAGYIVLAPAGRKTLHHYPRPDEKGLGWDNWYRQLNPAGDVTVRGALYRPNADAVAIDHFVELELSTGRVDPNRIYIVGWSNGAAMAYLYGLNRPNIAAAVLYSAPDPFGALGDPCPQTPVSGAAQDDSQIEIFNPALPAMHIHNSCDIAGLCPNAERMSRRLRALSASLRDSIIEYTGAQVAECTLSCGTDEDGATAPGADLLGYSLGILEHARWPRGWTPIMLDFLRSHPAGASKITDGGRSNESHLAD
jgi:pimeloyl-ACP methyl ester carboxylesterase